MPAPNHDFPHKWIEETLEDTRDPFLRDHPEIASDVEDAMEAIAERPYAPPFPWEMWRGEESENWRIAHVSEHLHIIYEPSQVHTWVGLVSIIYLP